MDRMHTYQAGIMARYLTEELFRADAIQRYAGRDAAYHINNAMEQFQELAGHLGYELVKRDTQQEAA